MLRHLIIRRNVASFATNRSHLTKPFLAQLARLPPSESILPFLHKHISFPPFTHLSGPHRAQLYENIILLLVEKGKWEDAVGVWLQMTKKEGLEASWWMKGVILGISYEAGKEERLLENLRFLPATQSSDDVLHLMHVYQHCLGFGTGLLARIVEGFIGLTADPRITTLYTGLLAKDGRVDQALDIAAASKPNTEHYTAILANTPVNHDLDSDTTADQVLTTMESQNVTTTNSVFNVLIRDQARRAGVRMTSTSTSHTTSASGPKANPTKAHTLDDSAEITRIWDSIVSSSDSKKGSAKQDQQLALEKAFVLYHALCEVGNVQAGLDDFPPATAINSNTKSSTKPMLTPDFYTYRTLWQLLARRPKWKDLDFQADSPIVHPRKLFYDMTRYYLRMPSSTPSTPTMITRSPSKSSSSSSKSSSQTNTKMNKARKYLAQNNLLLNTALLTFLARGDYPGAAVVLGCFGMGAHASVSSFGCDLGTSSLADKGKSMKSRKAKTATLASTSVPSTTNTVSGSSGDQVVPLRTYRIVLTHLYHRVSEDLRRALRRGPVKGRPHRRESTSSISIPDPISQDGDGVDSSPTSRIGIWARWILDLGETDLRGFRALVSTAAPNPPTSTTTSSSTEGMQGKSKESPPHCLLMPQTPHEKIIKRILDVSSGLKPVPVSSLSSASTSDSPALKTSISTPTPVPIPTYADIYTSSEGAGVPPFSPGSSSLAERGRRSGPRHEGLGLQIHPLATMVQRAWIATYLSSPQFGSGFRATPSLPSTTSADIGVHSHLDAGMGTGSRSTFNAQRQGSDLQKVLSLWEEEIHKARGEMIYDDSYSLPTDRNEGDREG